MHTRDLISQMLEALSRIRNWAEADKVNYTGDHPVALVREAITAAREYLAQPEQPSLSHLMPSTQERIKEWLADGTFVSRAIGVMGDQEREIIALEKKRAAPPLSESDIRAEFGKLYPNDIGILELAENNSDYKLEAIGARHHWTAFLAGAKTILATARSKT